MRRFALILMVLAAFTTTAAAEGMMIGAKGGLNIAKAYGDDVPDDADWAYGFIGGGFFNYMFAEMFAVQPELLYAMKGWKVTAADETEVDVKLNYIEIPVLLKVMIPTEGMIDPSIFAGPSIGFLMTAEADDVDIKDNLKSTDFGLVVGAGIDYMLQEGKGAIMLDARYSLGLTTVDDTADEADVKNHGIAVMVGYGYAF